MSRPRQYRQAASFKRDPHAFEALLSEPKREPLVLDEDAAWPLPSQSNPATEPSIQSGESHA